MRIVPIHSASFDFVNLLSGLSNQLVSRIRSQQPRWFHMPIKSTLPLIFSPSSQDAQIAVGQNQDLAFHFDSTTEMFTAYEAFGFSDTAAFNFLSIAAFGLPIIIFNLQNLNLSMKELSSTGLTTTTIGNLVQVGSLDNTLQSDWYWHKQTSLCHSLWLWISLWFNSRWPSIFFSPMFLSMALKSVEMFQCTLSKTRMFSIPPIPFLKSIPASYLADDNITAGRREKDYKLITG